MIVSAHDGYPRWVAGSADFIEVDVRRDEHSGAIILAHDPPRPGADYPRLDDALEAVDGRIGLHLDLKEAGFEVELVTRALEQLEPAGLVVTPDFEESARIIKRQFPSVRVSPLDFVTLDQQYATEERLRSYRLPVWVWTVDDKKLMKRFLADPRIECIITNRPDLALKLRKERS